MRKVLAILCILMITASFGIDELFITVKVMDYNPRTGTIKAVGVSGPCKGYKMNLISKPGMDASKLLNKEISVMIDSSECQDEGTYRIKGSEKP